jgi:ketosteroid isomerase-like protein
MLSRNFDPSGSKRALKRASEQSGALCCFKIWPSVENKYATTYFSLANTTRIVLIELSERTDLVTSYEQTRIFIKELYASYTQGDIGPTLDAMSDDIVFEYVGPKDIFPFCGIRRGKAEFANAAADISKQFEIISLNVKRVLVDDQGYVAVVEAKFRERSTGITMAFDVVDVAKTESDMIVEVREYWDVDSVTQNLLGKKLVLGEAPQSFKK